MKKLDPRITHAATLIAESVKQNNKQVFELNTLSDRFNIPSYLVLIALNSLTTKGILQKSEGFWRPREA